ETRAGAAGTTGVGHLARAAPDGYTFGIGQWGTNVANGAIYATLPYDLVKDFEPIALIATQPFLIVARNSMPAGDLRELIAWIKANADKATQGNSGIGTPSHAAGGFLRNAVAAPWHLGPYPRAGLAVPGLVAGNLGLVVHQP